MKIKTVWGVLPYFVTERSGKWGSARGPFVKLPKDASDDLKAHEAWHVKQWYAYWFVFGGLSAIAGYFAPRFGIPMPVGALAPLMVGAWWWTRELSIYAREIAAYGESLRNLKGEPTDYDFERFARLATNERYDYGDPVEQDDMLDDLNEAYHTGRLF